MERQPTFFKCICDAEALEIQVDTDEDIKHGMPPLVYLAFWRLGNISRPLTWKERFRWMWKILWSGNPWSDQLVFDAPTFNKLRDSIDEADNLLRDIHQKYMAAQRPTELTVDIDNAGIKLEGGVVTPTKTKVEGPTNEN